MIEPGALPLLWRLSFLLSLIVVGATRMLVPALLPTMIRSGMVSPNYKGRSVVRAGGMIPVLVSTAALLFWSLTPLSSRPELSVLVTGLLLATLGFAMVGFMDDVFGDRSAGGFRGHFQRLVRGDVTTGGLKAIFGGLVALAVAGISSRSFFEWMLNAFIIAASANAINLFDLRPGRALKLFFGSGLLLWLGTFSHPGWVVTAPSFAAWAAFAPEDLGGRAMLGDGGANAAGALLGVVAVVTAGMTAKAVLALMLALLHIATERGSITTFITKIPLLRRLDEWGRGQEP